MIRFSNDSDNGGSAGKESVCNAGDAGNAGWIPRSRRSFGVENGNPLQYYCLKNPTEESGGLQFMGLKKVRHDWATAHALLTNMHTQLNKEKDPSGNKMECLVVKHTRYYSLQFGEKKLWQWFAKGMMNRKW